MACCGSVAGRVGRRSDSAWRASPRSRSSPSSSSIRVRRARRTSTTTHYRCRRAVATTRELGVPELELGSNAQCRGSVQRRRRRRRRRGPGTPRAQGRRRRARGSPRGAAGGVRRLGRPPSKAASGARERPARPPRRARPDGSRRVLCDRVEHGGGPNAVIPTPAPNGRRTTQSAQLQLIASANRIDDGQPGGVHVVGIEGGVVKSSTITAAGGSSGYASFQLSIPSAKPGGDDDRALAAALRARRLAHRRRPRTSTPSIWTGARPRRRAGTARELIKQLANASTQGQIDSLTAQIHEAEATIVADRRSSRR